MRREIDKKYRKERKVRFKEFSLQVRMTEVEDRLENLG